LSGMTPQEIVHELDKYIVGQSKAKRAVAIALRNRWRRQQVPDPLRQEITPKNILMIGPTGVGKTEIARRLARLADAPFIKVEATKFTEVGYVGRDVDTIVRDLVEISVKQTREQAMKRVRTRAQEAAEERVLDTLLPAPRGVGFQDTAPEESATRQKFRKKLREGELDEKEIDIEVAVANPQMEILAPPGMEELTNQIQGMLSNLGGGRRRLRKMKIKEAMQALTDEEAARLKDYLLKGGFLWADDFWGSYAWEAWTAEFAKVLPPSQYAIRDLPLDHPMFRSMFVLPQVPQIPSINCWMGECGGQTSERGYDSAQVHFRGIQDGRGRLMVLMSHNTDIADSWEREGEDPAFFYQFSPRGYALGVDVLLHAMTH